MASTIVDHVARKPRRTRGDGGSAGRIRRDGGDGRPGPTRHYDPYQTLTWVLIIPVVMLFVGLTSALVVRRGMSEDWVPVRLPSILGINTVILVISSITFILALRALSGHSREFRVLLWVTAALGTLFLAGQLAAWRQLAARGAFLSTDPSSAFFYVLTASHGMHLIGALTALLYLTIRALRAELTPRRESALRTTAVFWHFMGVLWIYLFSILTLWR